MNPFLVKGVLWISENLIYTYFVGIVIGMMIVDFSYSVHLATKLKEFKQENDLRFEEYKKIIRKRFKELKREE